MGTPIPLGTGMFKILQADVTKDQPVRKRRPALLLVRAWGGSKSVC